MIFGILAAIVVYSLAVERTGVSLEQITSENRQNQLVRIIRALARPELVTYDFEQINTDVDFFIPCGDDGPATSGGVTLSQGCGDPEQIITVTGTGFEPFAQGRLQFIPDSEFDISLPLGLFEADENGNFTEEVELPDRPSGNPQILRVQVPNRLGTWGDRQEVWTDTNENGVRDLGLIGTRGLEVTVDGGGSDIPAAALLDPTNQVTHFVTTGESIVAVDGPANGTAPDLLGDPTSEDVFIENVTADGRTASVTVGGPTDTDVAGWRVALYDGATGEVLTTEFLGDQIELSPRISEQSRLTFEKIVDTVFLALVATTVGLSLALPLSFVAARNLMKDVSSTVLGLGVSLISIPLGLWLGLRYANLQRSLLGDVLESNVFRIVAVVAGGAVLYYLGRQIFFGDEVDSLALRTGRSLATLAGAGIAFEALFALLTEVGEALKPAFGIFDFVPGLFATIGEVGTVLLPALIAVGGASIVLGLARRLGQWLSGRLPESSRKVLGYIVLAIAGAILAALIGAAIDWLYQIANPTVTFVIPAVVGAMLGLIAAFFGYRRGGEIKTGLSIYYVARTIFNTLRSIEPLVMVIVFVVWVGFGEFAGSLALALHTAAALAKLYSEQVESISEGPLEAVRATGANRLQSIVYAVVPQIVPPYIAFTMYRWDINVRMSTILGFAGGGGIGFLLNQNVQLGDFRAAAVQMLAIAIVVATMDYLSSRLRERFT